MTIYLNPPQQRPGPMAGFGQGAQVLSNAFQNAELNKVLEDATQNPDMTQQDVMKMLFAAPNMSPQMKMQGAAALQKLFPEKAPVNLQQITGTSQSFNPRTGEARDIPGYKPPPKERTLTTVEQLQAAKERVASPEKKAEIQGVIDKLGYIASTKTPQMKMQPFTNLKTSQVVKAAPGSVKAKALEAKGFVEGTFRSGMDIQVGPDGTLISTGVSRGGNMGVKAKNTVEENLIKTQEGYARIRGINKQYNAKYLKYGTRFKEWGRGVAEKLGKKMSPQDKQDATDYWTFKRDAISNINLYIKEITGAQMSEKEADRLRLAIPDPGEGIFDGDSPTRFEASMAAVEKQLKGARLRATYNMKKGLNLSPDELELLVDVRNMDEFVQKRAVIIGEGLEQSGAFENLTDEQATALVLEKVRAEFY